MYHINIQFTVGKGYLSFVHEIMARLINAAWVTLDHFHVVWQPERKGEEE